MQQTPLCGCCALSPPLSFSLPPLLILEANVGKKAEIVKRAEEMVGGGEEGFKEREGRKVEFQAKNKEFQEQEANPEEELEFSLPLPF